MHFSGNFLTLILLWITQGTPVTHPSDQSPAPLEADLVVYDATPAGISASIAGRRVSGQFHSSRRLVSLSGSDQFLVPLR